MSRVGNSVQGLRFPSISEIGAATIIIAVLSAAMVPAVISARQQQADETKQCMSNIKLIGLALMQYTQDYDEYFPPAYKGAPQTWAGRIYSYVQSPDLYRCPSDVTVADAAPRPSAEPISYGLNSNLLSEAALTDPTKTVTYFEVSGARVQLTLPDEGTRGYWHRPASMMLSPSGDGLGIGPEWGWRGPGQTPITYMFTRHNDGANYGFTDGHVKWFTPDEVSKGKMYDPNKPHAGGDVAASAASGTVKATFSPY